MMFCEPSSSSILWTLLSDCISHHGSSLLLPVDIRVATTCWISSSDIVSVDLVDRSGSQVLSGSMIQRISNFIRMSDFFVRINAVLKFLVVL